MTEEKENNEFKMRLKNNFSNHTIALVSVGHHAH